MRSVDTSPRPASHRSAGPERRLAGAAGWFSQLPEPINRLAGSRIVRTVLPLAILAIAAWLIHSELKAVSWRQLLSALASTPPWAAALSVLFTVCDYGCLAVLEGYALGFIGRPLAPARVALAASGASAMSNAMGFGLASGTAVRLRLYAFARLTAADVAKITALLSAVVYVGGLVALGLGAVLAIGASSRALGWPPWSVAAIGVLLLVPAVGWFLIARRYARAHAKAPDRRGRIAILAAGVGNWVFQAAALFALAAHPVTQFPALLAAFSFGGLIGSTVGVPADLGVLEAAVIGSGSLGPAHQAAAALILFRLIFHLAPLVIATVAMGGRQAVKLARRRA